jgi:hypothetical protein
LPRRTFEKANLRLPLRRLKDVMQFPENDTVAAAGSAGLLGASSF